MEGQISLFAQESGSGRMSQAATVQTMGSTFRWSSTHSSKLKNQTFMLLDLRPGAGNLLGPYWEYDPPWLGPPGTLDTSACPKGAEDAFLSLILAAIVPSRYYLSKRACLGILRRSRERGKPLPAQLKAALEMQAGLRAYCPEELSAPMAFHMNQRDEAIDLGETAGALMATSNLQMQTFVAQTGRTHYLTPWDAQQKRIFLPDGVSPTLSSGESKPGGLLFAAGFCAGAGPSAGSIGYQEEVSPTLKASPSGNMMPSVLCLNDQGGGIMDCTENMSGTLRAQEHGHQPAVMLTLYESHGKDARYTGPHPVSPTLSARAGTGGGNLPLALRAVPDGSPPPKHTVYTRKRVDVFQPDDIASTESARQHKDATDLVCQTASQEDTGPCEERPLLIRRLTPSECEKLQGYPPDWTDLPGAADAPRYRSLGNSVAVACVEYLMQGVALALRADGMDTE